VIGGTTSHDIRHKIRLIFHLLQFPLMDAQCSMCLTSTQIVADSCDTPAQFIYTFTVSYPEKGSGMARSFVGVICINPT